MSIRRIYDAVMAYPLLDPNAYEPDITDIDELRAHRKTRLALGYRIFGALRWGALGDATSRLAIRNATITSGWPGTAPRSTV